MSGDHRAGPGPRPEPGAERPRRGGAADVEALQEVAAILPQHRRRGLVLYPFGDDRQPEAMAEVDRGADDGGAVAVGRHVEDEGLIDLDFAHREPLEVGERGVAGAEVVDRDLDPGLMQPLERAFGFARDDGALRDLETELL